jgi:hypothetical protein
MELHADRATGTPEGAGGTTREGVGPAGSHVGLVAVASPAWSHADRACAPSDLAVRRGARRSYARQVREVVIAAALGRSIRADDLPALHHCQEELRLLHGHAGRAS